MTELRTLKDIDFQKVSINEREKQIISFVNEQLKEEAIKWAKKAKDKLDEVDELNLKDFYHCEVAYGNGILHAFRDFFNLTEEDLK